MKAKIPIFFDLHLLTIFYTLFLKFSFLSASGEKTDTLKLISDFRSSFFSGSKEDAYYLLDLGLESDEKVVGYVDASNNKYLDLITVKKDDNGLNFYINYYNYTSSKFYKNGTSFITIGGNFEVSNVFANSLYPGGKIAYAITLKGTDEELYTLVYCYKNSSKTYEKVADFNKTNVVIGDLDGDRRIDFIYFNSADSLRYVAHFDDNDVPHSEQFLNYLANKGDGCETSSSTNAFLDKKISYRGASAIIDITSDCKNDLLLTSEDDKGNLKLEIYRGIYDSTKTTKLCLEDKNLYDLNSTFGPFSIGDFNGDGYLDLIFPIIDTNQVVIAYNNYTPGYSWTENFCEKHPVNEYSQKLFDLQEDNIVDESTIDLSKNLTTVRFTLKKQNYTYPYSKLYKNPNFNTLIRIGDFKSDGIPGILTIQEDYNKTNKDPVRKVRIYQNHYKEKKEGKTDKPIWNLEHEFELNSSMINPTYASFFDFDESGQLSFLFMGEGQNQTIGFFNAYYPDTYFIKAKCMLEKNNYYTTEIGTNYRYIVTNNDGTRRMDVAFQMAQTTQMTLYLPYALVGIGRSNNYIENFNVISNTNEYRLTKSDLSDNSTFTPIIPKSQMLITKGRKMEVVKGVDTYSVNWEIELIVNPTNMILILIIVIAAILIIILIVIIILHLQEIKEDKQQESEKFTAWFA